MRLLWDRVLDRAWLGLAAAAAVTVAVHEGAAVGRLAWTLGSGGAAQAAQAAQAAPAGTGRAGPSARAAACGPAAAPAP